MEAHSIKVRECRMSPLLDCAPLETRVIQDLIGARDHADEASERKSAWSGWVESVRVFGIMEPVKFYRRDGVVFVCDGRNRLRAAEEAGLDVIPGVEVAEADVPQIALASLAHRKTVSKGGLAYLALVFYPHLAAGKPGRKPIKGNHYPINSLDELASLLGVSVETVKDAADTFRFFEHNPQAKHDYERRVIAGSISLGDARKNPDACSTKGKERKPSDWGSACKGFRSLTSQMRNFDKWKEKERDEARKHFLEVTKKLPPAAKDFLASVLKESAESSATPTK